MLNNIDFSSGHLNTVEGSVLKEDPARKAQAT